MGKHRTSRKNPTRVSHKTPQLRPGLWQQLRPVLLNKNPFNLWPSRPPTNCFSQPFKNPFQAQPRLQEALSRVRKFPSQLLQPRRLWCSWPWFCAGDRGYHGAAPHVPLSSCSLSKETRKKTQILGNVLPWQLLPAWLSCALAAWSHSQHL